MSLIIEGDMGKGGKTPVEAKDSLISEQTAKVLFAVGEGVIDSVEEIYLDTITIDNFDATYDSVLGTSNQAVIKGFINTESPLPGFASIVVERGTTKKPDQEPPGFQANWYNASIPYDVDAARLTFLISIMSFLDGDGNLVGSSVTIEIWLRESNTATWALYGTVTKKGKTTHGYTFDVNIDRPINATNASPWGVRVRRITPDSASTKKQNVINWAAVTQIYYKQLNYPNTALIGVTLNDAAQFGSRIPEIMFRLKGKLVSVFSNYDPVTRTYTGIWDGTFNTLTKYYTNNPALILLDVLTDTRSGIGLTLSDIDIYSIYNLAKYADELISDGYGNQIPRYTLDYQFQNRDSVSNFLSQILSICNANLITNEFGQISVIFQQPGQVIKQNVTNATVIDGSFTYQSSDIEKRTTLVNVTYNNGLNFGRTDTATVSDDTLISRYGLQVLDILLPGCYYEAQAIRKARWALYTNCYFTNTVTFAVFLDGMNYKIGNLIRVFDNYNQDNSQAGVVLTSVVGSTDTVVTFDRTITLPSGTHTFYCQDSIGNEISKSISGPATLSSVTLTGQYNIILNSAFIISGPTAGKLYRVISIDKSEDEIYSITALEFSEDIFTFIDGTITLTAPTGDFNNLSNFSTPAVTSIGVLENFGTNGVYSTSILQISWVWDASHTQKYGARYKLAWSKDDGITTIVNDINSDTYDIPNPTPGTYLITVWAINPFTGIMSQPLSYTYAFRVVPGTSSLQPPINLRVAGTSVVTPQPSSLNFATPDLNLIFDYNPLNTNVVDALYDYVVEIWDSTGVTKKATYIVLPYQLSAATDPNNPDATYTPLGGLFSLPFNDNINIFGGTPARSFIVKVYSRDFVGDLSSPIVISVSNPVPAFTTLTIVADINKVLITVDASTDIDVANYLIYRGTTSGFTPGAGNLIYRGKGNRVNIETPDNAIYYYKAAISDSFGETGITYSSVLSAASVSKDADVYTYTGLTFTPNNPSANSVSWTSFTVYKNGGSAVTVNSGNAAWTTGKLYLFYLPGNANLQYSSSLATAVGGRIIATYEGGTALKGGDGSAFISGDQILAGSVGANQLVANSAVITGTAQIANGIITDAKIATLNANKIINNTLIRITSKYTATASETITSTGTEVELTSAAVTKTFTHRDDGNSILISANLNLDCGTVLLTKFFIRFRSNGAAGDAIYKWTGSGYIGYSAYDIMLYTSTASSNSRYLSGNVAFNAIYKPGQSFGSTSAYYGDLIIVGQLTVTLVAVRGSGVGTTTLSEINVNVQDIFA